MVPKLKFSDPNTSLRQVAEERGRTGRCSLLCFTTSCVFMFVCKVGESALLVSAMCRATERPRGRPHTGSVVFSARCEIQYVHKLGKGTVEREKKKVPLRIFHFEDLSQLQGQPHKNVPACTRAETNRSNKLLAMTA